MIGAATKFPAVPQMPRVSVTAPVGAPALQPLSSLLRAQGPLRVGLPSARNKGVLISGGICRSSCRGATQAGLVLTQHPRLHPLGLPLPLPSALPRLGRAATVLQGVGRKEPVGRVLRAAGPDAHSLHFGSVKELWVQVKGQRDLGVKETQAL